MAGVSLSVALGERSYPIQIGSGLLSSRADWAEHIAGRQVMIVTNETVAPLYLATLEQQLSDYELSTLILPDGEQFKTLDTLSSIYDALIDARHSRNTTLIALGGGVVGDMVGFAAATYQRGVRFLQCPTTLLAQVDSSVGGKTAVNHPRGKNMIGAFHQPHLVVIDLDTLVSLPEREYAAGLAEVIKYGLIVDKEFLHWLENNMQALWRRDTKALEYAIATSCSIKARVVEEDEREQGRRALLNLGHTFGHAIEAISQYSQWLHGEAVAIGTMMALDLSQRLSWLSGDDVARVKALYDEAHLPTALPSKFTDVDTFLSAMGLDKKVIDGRLRLVLLKSLGDAVVTADTPPELLSATLAKGLNL